MPSTPSEFNGSSCSDISGHFGLFVYGEAFRNLITSFF